MNKDNRSVTSKHIIMKKRLSILVTSLIVLLFSCSRGPVYESYHSFKDDIWNRFDIVKFNIPLNEENKAYDFYFTVKYTSDFAESSLPVYLIMNTPTGEERMREIPIQTNRPENKEELQPDSTRMIRIPVWKGVSISDKGTCIVSVETIYPKIQAMGIEKIGIVVEKAASDNKQEE